MIDRFKRSLISQLISYSNKDVRLFADNLFEKVRQLGILPEYIDRTKVVREFFDIDTEQPILKDLKAFSFGVGYWGSSLEIIKEAGDNIGKSWTLSFEYYTDNALQSISLFDQSILFENNVLTVYGSNFNITAFKESDVNKIRVVRNGDMVSVYHEDSLVGEEIISTNVETVFTNLYTVEDNLTEDNPVIGNIVIYDRNVIKNIWILDYFEDSVCKDIGQGDYDFFSIWYSLCFYIGLLNIYRRKLVFIEESSDGLRRFLDSREVFYKRNSSFDELLIIYSNWIGEIEKRGTELPKLPYNFSKEIGSTYTFELPGVIENKQANSGVAILGDLDFDLITEISLEDNYEFSFEILFRPQITFDFKLFSSQTLGNYIMISSISVSETEVTMSIEKYKAGAIAFSTQYTVTGIEEVKRFKLISIGSFFVLYMNEVVIHTSTNVNNSGNYTFDKLIIGDTAVLVNIKAIKMNSSPDGDLHNQISVTEIYSWECNDGSGIFLWSNKGHEFSAVFNTAVGALAYTDIWHREPIFNNTGYLGIDGELRRLIDYDYGEFLYELCGESELGLVMDISSPISEEANISNLNKAFEKGAVSRMNKYPISIDPVIPVVDGGWIKYQIPINNTDFCGINADLISEPDWKVNLKYKPSGVIPFIPIPVSLIGDSFDGYEISFVINYDGAIDLKFGILPYDDELDYLSDSILSYVSGASSEYFLDEVSFDFLQGNDIFIRGVYSPNKISTALEKLNIDFGSNLYSSDNLISSIALFIAFKSSTTAAVTVKVKDINVRILSLNTSKGIIDPKNNIFGVMKNKTGKFNKDILKEITNKFDPFDCTSNIKFI